MGILRLFFAYVVVIFHSPEGILLKPIHPALAVQCFYTISGFYMQLIIGKYHDAGGKNWKIDFYQSRFIRIFSLYYVFLIITLFAVYNGSFPSFSYFIEKHQILEAVISVSNNILIFGQSLLRFFSYDIDAGKFIFVSTYDASHIIQNKALFTAMPMSWTLEIELMFYLLAPFILLRSLRVIMIIIASSIALRVWLGYNGYNQHSWLYGFFPSELAIFLIGAVSCRGYLLFANKKYRQFYIFNLFTRSLFFTKVINNKFYKRALNILIQKRNQTLFYHLVYFLILWMLFDFYYSGWHSISGGVWSGGITGVPHKYWWVLVITALCLPLLFALTKGMKWDKFIGNLSYPVYLGHGIVLRYLSTFQVEDRYQSIYAFSITATLSILIVILLEGPIDKYRHRKFLKSSE